MLLGLDMLKKHTNPAWLRQPDMDMDVFKSMPAVDAFWELEKPAYVYDKRAAYLNAASQVQLGVGTPIYQENTPFSGKSGVYFLEIAPFSTEIPEIVEPGKSWQWEPVVRFLKRNNVTFQVHKSYIWPESHRVLYPFYDIVRKIRETNPESAKFLYTQTFGMLAHKPPNYNYPAPRTSTILYRPDWWYSLVAWTKVRMYEHIEQVYQHEGVLPVSLKVDCVGYNQKVSTLTIGEKIGQFKEPQACRK